MGTSTITSHSQPASPPSQLYWWAGRRRTGRRCAGARVTWPAPVVTVVATSRSFQLAFAGTATAEPAQQQRERETDEHEDDRDHARRPHQVGLEPALVHVQREYPRRVARAAGGEHEDEVEEGQRADDHQRRRREIGRAHV